jgi:hypothetical protein
MPEGSEPSFALRRADQPSGDLYAIHDELEFIKEQLARLPTRKEVAQLALMATLGGAGLTVALMLAFFSRGF